MPLLNHKVLLKACFLAGIVLTQALATRGFAADGMSSEQVDQLVDQVMDKYQVPGMAIGIVKDGEVIHAKGYGIRQLGKSAGVNLDTLFSIASNSKAFTTASISILVDDGKLNWDDKVFEYIPEFQLADPWVTREFTIRDLVVHRSGLGLGAGDLMFWPSPEFSRQEIIRNLRHLQPISSFRTEFAYDNLLYIVAGEVVAAASGMSFEDFVDKRILKPLNMKRCAANRTRLKREKNFAEHHAVIDGKLQQVERLVPPHERTTIAAAGGLQCSVSSMLKWVSMHLAGGELPDGTPLISREQHNELWTPQTLMKTSPWSKKMFGTNFTTYGLGWGITDVQGYKHVSHGGGLLGMITHVDMIPDLNLGVITFTNQQSGIAMRSVYSSILASYIGGEQQNWVEVYDNLDQERRTKAAQAVEKASPDSTDKAGTTALGLSAYAGVYQDPWFGEVNITQDNGRLYFTATRSSRLKGYMEPFNGNTLIVRWDDRTLEADAYVMFSTDFTGAIDGMTMKAVSAMTDFSFDFHDLNFSKLTNNKH